MVKDIIKKNELFDVHKSKIEKLKELFPNCFDEKGQLRIDMLKDEINGNIKMTRESFELNFLGKSYAKMLAGLDSETVIRPDIIHNTLKENINSKNIMISGDNLDALKHLIKSYEEKIKCIYIDPPYNTETDDFCYFDKFNFDKDTLVNKLDISEEEADRIVNMTSNSSSSHSAWLTFMYPRLYLAKNLLSNDGAIFISIGDDEINNLKLLCDNIFGEENFVAMCPRKTRGSATTKSKAELQKLNDYVLIYLKNREIGEFNLKISGKKEYPLEDSKGKFYVVNLQDNGPSGTRTARPNLYYPIYVNEKGEFSLEKESEYSVEYLPEKHKNDDGRWMWSKEKFLKDKQDLCINNNKVCIKHYYNPNEDQNKYEQERTWLDKYQNAKGTSTLNNIFGIKGLFSNPKPIELIKFLVSLIADKDSIILDFFGGSGSTAHAVMDLNKDGGNRKYIIIQLPEDLNANYKNSSKEARVTLEAQINYLNSINKPLTLDEITKQRLILTDKIYNKNNDPRYGFKHYTLIETNQNLLNKMEDFKPEVIDDTNSIIEEYGNETVIETWKISDGYGFDSEVIKLNASNYEFYRCNDSLYLINPHININTIKEIMNMYKEESFNCDKIVVFGYSFYLEEMEMIKNNFKQIKNFKNIDVKIYVRY